MITHTGTVTIQTDRLILRRFAAEDAKEMFKNWASDPLVTKFLSWKPHSNLRVTTDLLDTWIKRYKDPKCYNWVIEYNGTIIGNISVVTADENEKRADLGYCIGSRWWKMGITTEAAKAIIDHLLKNTGFEKVRICHVLKNPASGRVAQKCGLKFIGTERGKSIIHTGEALDIAIYETTASKPEESAYTPVK